MATTAGTCIWSDGPIDEAAAFCTSLVPGSEVKSVMPWPEGDREHEPLVVDVTLAGVVYSRR